MEDMLRWRTTWSLLTFQTTAFSPVSKETSNLEDSVARYTRFGSTNYQRKTLYAEVASISKWHWETVAARALVPFDPDRIWLAPYSTLSMLGSTKVVNMAKEDLRDH